MVKSVILLLLLASCTSQKHLVVFSETSGYRHESIPDGAKAITEIGEELGYK